MGSLTGSSTQDKLWAPCVEWAFEDSIPSLHLAQLVPSRAEASCPPPTLAQQHHRLTAKAVQFRWFVIRQEKLDTDLGT
jgi:hypothetical protein